jgi:MioC protein
MTGYAEICGEEIETALTAAGMDCERQLMDGLEASAFDDFDLIIIVSSTYGQGDIPDNGQVLFGSVERCVSLTGKQFAVFGLGDMTYSATFCAAGVQWDALLAAKGASRLVDLERHDASGGTLAEDVAAEWAAGWAGLVTAQ